MFLGRAAQGAQPARGRLGLAREHESMIGTGSRAMAAAGSRGPAAAHHRAGRGRARASRGVPAETTRDGVVPREVRGVFVIIASLPNRTILRRTATRRPQRLRRVARPRSEVTSPVDSVVKIFEVGADKRARPQTSRGTASTLGRRNITSAGYHTPWARVSHDQEESRGRAQAVRGRRVRRRHRRHATRCNSRLGRTNEQEARRNGEEDRRAAQGLERGELIPHDPRDTPRPPTTTPLICSAPATTLSCHPPD